MANLNPFSKVLQKQAGRAKERLLQNLGKADRTTDEDFDLHVKNFSKQQNAVLRLQKEFKNYHQCLRAVQAARRSLMDTVCELYEPCWDGVEQFLIKSEVSNKNFEDFCDNLNNQILAPVGTYLCQFPEITNKISKRNRKLLDFDNSRHNLQNLETMKKKEDAKLTKAKEQLDDARNNFETINNELHEELPALYDSRVSFFASNLQCLFLTECNYHTKDAITSVEIGELLKQLNKAYAEGAFAERPIVRFASPNMESDLEYVLASEMLTERKGRKRVQENKAKESGVQEGKGPEGAEQEGVEQENMEQESKVQESAEQESKVQESKVQDDKFSSGSASGSAAFSTPTTTLERNASLDMESVEEGKEDDKFEGKAIESKSTTVNKSNQDLSVADIPISSNPLAYNVLYQVQGTYKYAAEDVDELSFDVGDTIDVVEYDDPEEQEEGWLMGVFNGKKGLFPANFTSRM